MLLLLKINIKIILYFAKPSHERSFYIFTNLWDLQSFSLKTFLLNIAFWCIRFWTHLWISSQILNIINRNISKMAWYFNFCAPTLPNDPIINLHRYFQTGCLMGFMVLYIVVHIYYKMCLPAPTKQK